MGTLTLADLKDELRTALGGRTDQDARLARAINLAQVRAARLWDFDELRRTYKATNFYNNNSDDRFLAFPANIRKVHSLVLEDGANSRKLTYVPPRQWDKFLSSVETSRRGRPTHYTKWQDQIEFYPIPDKQYTWRLRCTVWPADLSADTDKSDLDEKDDLIIALAASWIYLTLGDNDRAAYWYRVARSLFQEGMSEEGAQVDLEIKAGDPVGAVTAAQYWSDPFVRSAP